MPAPSRAMRRRVKIVLVLLILIALPIGAEVILAVVLARPGLAPVFLLDGLRRAYVAERWDPFQADLERVHYDAEVTYLGNPGTFRYVNPEFDTQVAINRLGLRDDERSLEAPDVIALGDSYTMGWGVEQDEAYPQVLERSAGVTVLNAGMASFGTARETILLGRIDTSGVRAVVVQYFANDYAENAAFVENAGALPIKSEEDFLQMVRAHEARKYRPFAYLQAFFQDRPFFPELEDLSDEAVAATMLRVLASCEALPPDVPILFLELGAWGSREDIITPAVERLLDTDEEFAPLRGRVVPLPLTDTLGPADFFDLDPHLTPAGHAKVASAVDEALREAGVLPSR